ncbi:hypothetical protein B0H21DRAFT_839429 [Amylocystis lapponica]|nr:hypothetical protein B0H21DRAFT_839429 [Amylocystis lapponica]
MPNASVRNLVLETPYTIGYSTDEDELPDIYITKDQFPNLRSLSLTRFVLPWTSPLFTSLAHLHLFDLPDPEVSALLDIFAACPALETLSICIAGLATYDDTPKTRMVTLPHVRKLKVSNFAVLVPTLLQHLVLPAIVSLNIELLAIETSPWRPELETLADILPQHIATLPSSLLCVMLTYVLPLRPANRQVEEMWMLWEDPLHDFARILAFARVTKLVLLASDIWKPSSWHDFFVCLPHVEEISVCTDDESKFFIALAGLDDGQPVLPKLRKLVVQDAQLGKRAQFALMKVLRARAEKGVRLWRLSLMLFSHRRRRTIRSDVRDSLKRHVGILEVRKTTDWACDLRSRMSPEL